MAPVDNTIATVRGVGGTNVQDRFPAAHEERAAQA